MSSRSITVVVLAQLCLMAGLATACGDDDDEVPGNDAAAGEGGAPGGGRGGTSSTAGKTGGGNPSGGTVAMPQAGAGGEGAGGSTGVDCVQLTDFVHGLIAEDTNDKSAPTPVNGVEFCADPEDPKAFDDLF